MLIVAVGIIFVVGLVGDLNFGEALLRCLRAICLNIIAGIWLLLVRFLRVDTPGVDVALSSWFVGVLIKRLITAGGANGINVIDDVKGMASLAAAALALGLFSEPAVCTVMLHLLTLFAAALVTFFMVKFPYGFIFLGDVWAFPRGFRFRWFGISVLLNVPDVSRMTLSMARVEQCRGAIRSERRWRDERAIPQL